MDVGADHVSVTDRESATGHGTGVVTENESVAENGTVRESEFETVRGRRRGADTGDRGKLF